jgi:hypothetical protein
MTRDRAQMSVNVAVPRRATATRPYGGIWPRSYARPKERVTRQLAALAGDEPAPGAADSLRTQAEWLLALSSQIAPGQQHPRPWIWEMSQLAIIPLAADIKPDRAGGSSTLPPGRQASPRRRGYPATPRQVTRMIKPIWNSCSLIWREAESQPAIAVPFKRSCGRPG